MQLLFMLQKKDCRSILTLSPLDVGALAYLADLTSIRNRTYMNRLLSKERAVELLRTVQAASLPHVYDFAKHRIILLDKAGNEQVYFRLPFDLPPPDDREKREGGQVNYIILLIQSGNCAVGYFENGLNRDHKVFRSYMVRKKQGKSQLKYLKTKGKSRAGSRVRLSETMEFFENINERLQEYFEQYQIHRIAISCSKTLIPYLFNSKTETPFAKNDVRLYKIPRHIHTPIYEVMLDANKYLLKGELAFEETQREFVNRLLGETADPLEELDEEDFLDDEDL